MEVWPQSIILRASIALWVLCNLVLVVEARRISFFEEVNALLIANTSEYDDAVRPTGLSRVVSERRIRTPNEVEVMLGSEHFDKIIRHVLLPFLDGLFSQLKIPDIPIPGLPVELVLHNLMIEKLELANVKVLRNTASVGEVVLTLTLEADAHLIASLLIGPKGGNKLEVDIQDAMQLDLVLRRDANDILHLSVMRVELQQTKQAKNKLDFAGESWLNKALNIAVWASQMIIMSEAIKGVNNWGQKPGLNFPLNCLLGIGLGPSGQCSGSDFGSDGLTLVRPAGQASAPMCRAVLDARIKWIEISNQMSIHLVVGLDPWLEVTQLGSTDNSVQQTAHEWIGPVYRGRPMKYRSTDGRGKPTTNYKDALDNCVRDVGECGSVYAESTRDGELEYSVGRTPFPVKDTEDQWVRCAGEGEFCHFTDDKSQWGDPEKNINMYDFDAHGGLTDPMRLMRLRFGAFKTPTDYIERIGFDEGTGVPCRRDFFDKGLQRGGAATGFWETQYCKRLVAKAPEGTKCTTPACLAQGRCANDGVYCPLERPCVILQPGTSTPLRDFPRSKANSSGMKSSVFCIEQEVDRNGKRVCPRTPATKNCWAGASDAQAPFTQPIKVIRRERRSCTGPYHLPCWLDIVASNPPPPLEFHGGNIPSSSISLSLPTDVLNSVLATVYSTGLLRGFAFQLDQLPTVGALCSISKHFLCLSSFFDGAIKDSTPIKLQVQSTAPGKIMFESGGEHGFLRLSLALQLSIHVEKDMNLGLPIERMLRSKKQCVRKEGVLRVSWKDVTTKKEHIGPRWAELEKSELKLYTVHGRSKTSTFMLGSMHWNAEKDAKDVRCIKLKLKLKPTHRLCAESEGTINEWFASITSKTPCDTSVFKSWGNSEAARLSFGVEVRAGLVVDKSKYLCVRPDTESDEIIKHIGQLHSRQMFGQPTVKMATASVARPLLKTVIDALGVLKPMEVWNLEALAYNAGLKKNPAPRVEIGENRIFVTGQVAYDVGDEVQEGGLEFNMEANNPCIRPGDIKPGMGARLGSAMAAPLGVLKAMSPVRLYKNMKSVAKAQKGL